MDAELDQGFAKRNRWRRVKDGFAAGSTYAFSSFTIIVIVAIFAFVFSKGWSNLSWDFITGDYKATTSNVVTDDSITRTDNLLHYETGENEYFSSSWGIAFEQGKDKEGHAATLISYVDPNANINNWVDSTTKKPVSLKVGSRILSVSLWTVDDPNEAEVYAPDIQSAKDVCAAFDKCTHLANLSLQSGGLGMRGSLISTLWMILIAMAVALPLGVGASIYLAVISKDNAFTRGLRTLIDMISGIPSVIFGLVGGLVFVPIFGGKVSLLAGSFTVAVMILPVIVKSTEESIRAIPRKMSDASYALGASQAQTIFKIILPNALPGILTAVLLGIGRVIGESAALVFTSGTAIQDYIIPTQGSATMAVHIWTLMSGETRNIEASCTVSIVILFLILILNTLIKLIGWRVTRRQKGK